MHLAVFDSRRTFNSRTSRSMVSPSVIGQHASDTLNGVISDGSQMMTMQQSGMWQLF